MFGLAACCFCGSFPPCFSFSLFSPKITDLFCLFGFVAKFLFSCNSMICSQKCFTVFNLSLLNFDSSFYGILLSWKLEAFLVSISLCHTVWLMHHAVRLKFLKRKFTEILTKFIEHEKFLEQKLMWFTNANSKVSTSSENSLEQLSSCFSWKCNTHSLIGDILPWKCQCIVVGLYIDCWTL